MPENKAIQSNKDTNMYLSHQYKGSTLILIRKHALGHCPTALFQLERRKEMDT